MVTVLTHSFTTRLSHTNEYRIFWNGLLNTTANEDQTSSTKTSQPLVSFFVQEIFVLSQYSLRSDDWFVDTWTFHLWKGLCISFRLKKNRSAEKILWGPFPTDWLRTFSIERWKARGLRRKKGWKCLYFPTQSAFSCFLILIWKKITLLCASTWRLN